MKIWMFFILSVCFSIFSAFGQQKVKVFGKVTDFNNQPIDSASVWLKQNIDSVTITNKQDVFKNSCETFTDRNGYFSMEVFPGNYYCMYVIKEADYGKIKLEYWAWNLPIYKDFEIHPQYDRMEVYAMNGFEPQHGPFDSYMVYFRPMSLTKVLPYKKGELTADTLDIAPKALSKAEIQAKINGVEAEVLTINKIKIYTRNGKYMFAYMIQLLKPEVVTKLDDASSAYIEGYDKITIIIHSEETDEWGKGEYFLKRIGN